MGFQAVCICFKNDTHTVLVYVLYIHVYRTKATPLPYLPFLANFVCLLEFSEVRL